MHYSFGTIVFAVFCHSAEKKVYPDFYMREGPQTVSVTRIQSPPLAPTSGGLLILVTPPSSSLTYHLTYPFTETNCQEQITMCSSAHPAQAAQNLPHA